MFMLSPCPHFRCDIFALEALRNILILFYQIFSGEAPFQHLPEEEIRQAVVVDQERPDRPEDDDAVERGLDVKMWTLLERCWADNRTSRPSFQEIAALLEAWLGPEAAPFTNSETDMTGASSKRGVCVSRLPRSLPGGDYLPRHLHRIDIYGRKPYPRHAIASRYIENARTQADTS